MLFLVPLAVAGTLTPHPRGFVWEEGEDHAILYDPLRATLLAAGTPDALHDTRWDQPPQWAYRGSGTVVARRGRGEVVVRRGEMQVFHDGYRRTRTWLPEHWDLGETTFSVHGLSGVALCRGELLTPGRDRLPSIVQVDATRMVAGERGVLFPDRPGLWFDPRSKEIADLKPIEVTRVRSFASGAAGLHDDRPLVWDAAGRIVYLGDAGVAEFRVSPDGRILAERSPDDVLDLVDLPTGDVLFSAAVCAGTPWPHDDRSVSVDCGDRLVFARFGETIDVQRPAGRLRHLSLQDDHLRVVMGGDGMGRVYEAPLDGGPVREADHGTLSGQVKGYRYGRPVPLVVTEVHGRPVERATARAFATMQDAASAAGVTLRVASGFRTNAEQQALYDCYLSGDCNNGNLAARPGHSRHQSGHALDLNTHVTAVRDWLRVHAATYGFRATVASEPWHWEYGGAADPTAVRVDVLPVADPAAIVPLDVPFPTRLTR